MEKGVFIILAMMIIAYSFDTVLLHLRAQECSVDSWQYGKSIFKGKTNKQKKKNKKQTNEILMASLLTSSLGLPEIQLSYHRNLIGLDVMSSPDKS